MSKLPEWFEPGTYTKRNSDGEWYLLYDAIGVGDGMENCIAGPFETAEDIPNYLNRFVDLLDKPTNMRVVYRETSTHVTTVTSPVENGWPGG